MNQHLSSKQLCDWLIGQHGHWQGEHLRQCADCRSELEQLQNAVSGFRGSLERWSVSPPPPSRAVRRNVPRWILATAALSLLAAVPIYWNTYQQRAAAQAKADQVLLERIHTGLSRAVPASMEPLMQLVSKEERQ